VAEPELPIVPAAAGLELLIVLVAAALELLIVLVAVAGLATWERIAEVAAETRSAIDKFPGVPVAEVTTPSVVAAAAG
jgi:hypothetical protein